MTKRAFITGITGQDGSYLAEFLLDRGYEVHGLVRRTSTVTRTRIDHLYVDPHDPAARFFLHYGDITDALRLRDLLEKIEPNEVYNLAAQSHVRVSFDEPAFTVEVDAVGAMNLLEAVRRMPRLRAIQCLWAGVDGFWPFVPEGVSLHNAAGVHDASTAELALALMLARLRRLDGFARHRGEWNHGFTPALADRRVLIVGYGRIGAAIDRRLAGFEVDVVRVARTARETEGVTVHGFDDLPALLPEADVVVIGGGATGCFTARDAALRGLKVALVEARDFAAATSAFATTTTTAASVVAAE